MSELHTHTIGSVSGKPERAADDRPSADTSAITASAVTTPATTSAAAATIQSAIEQFPEHKARTLRFTCGAPRSATVIGDGSRALFLRSDGPEDSVTSLWLSTFDTTAGTHEEILLADPRELLPNADAEEVPAAERARRERAREGGQGIVSYSVDAAGDRVVFTINGQLFLTQIDDDGCGARTRQLAVDALSATPDADDTPHIDDTHAHHTCADEDDAFDIVDDTDPNDLLPVLNPRISPDGRHVLYTTGEHLVMVDIADWPQSNESNESGAPNTPDSPNAITPLHDGIRAIWGVHNGPDPAEHTWSIGLAEFAAGEEMNRYDGFWWSPDSNAVIFETFDSSAEPTWYISDPTNPDRNATSRRYPQALTRNADIFLTLVDLEFDGHGQYSGMDARRIAWDRKAYEYLAVVRWTAGHRPLLLVQNRLQNHDQVLQVEHNGTTTVLEEHTNPQWLDLIAGTPAFTPDGRLVCAFNDMDTDTNRLTVDGKAFTPVGWQVRTVLDVGDTDVLAVVQRTTDNPKATDVPDAWADQADEHDARSFDVVRFGYDGSITPVTMSPGVWTASRTGRGIVVSGRDMDHAKSQMVHLFALDADGDPTTADRFPALDNHLRADIANHAQTPGFTPNTRFVRLGEHRLYTAITRPSIDSPYAGAQRLPVLLKPYGGPGHQEVTLSQAAYWDAQWWADQGFLVVTADGRGTTGRGPRWDREIFHDMKRVTLADQVEAVHALQEAAPEADTDRVAMIGWSYGGFLSALAVLDAPQTVQAACAGAPPTDWTLYDTHYTERYLGLDLETYRSNSIIEDAPGLSRPLMLIHGFADDNVSIANSLRLSQALMAAGKPHTFLPLTGITHMTNDPTVARNLLILQRDFLIQALGMTPRA